MADELDVACRHAYTEEDDEGHHTQHYQRVDIYGDDPDDSCTEIGIIYHADYSSDKVHKCQ